MLLQNCQQQFCYISIEEKYLLRKELILSLYGDSPFMWMEGMHVCIWRYLFLTNNPDDKLVGVLWNIYLSLLAVSQSSLRRNIISKSIKADIFSARVINLYCILPILGGKKIKNPTYKGESERFSLSTQISAISEDGKFPPPQTNRSAFTEGLMKSDPLLTIKGASV